MREEARKKGDKNEVIGRGCTILIMNYFYSHVLLHKPISAVQFLSNQSHFQAT